MKLPVLLAVASVSASLLAPISDGQLARSVDPLLGVSGGGGEEQSLVSSEIQVLSPTEVAGATSMKGGWNKQPTSFTVYFLARTDTPAASWGTWLGG